MPIPHDPIQRANAAYVEEQYRRWLEDPSSVPEDWQWFFAGVEFAGVAPGAAGSAAAAPSGDTRSGGVFGLVTAYREFGHLIARLDPLNDPPASHPLLELSNFGLSEADLDRPVDPRPFAGEVPGTLRDLIAALRETYCGTLGIEYMDIPDKQRRDWLQERMERRRNRPDLGPDDRVRVLEKLLVADGLEQFLHVKYVGQKRFSLEGAAALIPMLDALIEESSALGVEQLVIGMPHRGRLNVLVNLLGKPLERMFSEFEGSFVPEHVQGHGDVKYHLGYSSRRESRDGRVIHLNLHYNPSHLEFVNPVVLGSVRAKQAFMNDVERSQGWPVLIHGDASFAGEGIVAETLTLAQLPAYQVGGTVHVIVNNQIGFTTTPEEGRPTRYCTDIARVVEAPVLHVNGDDPDAAVHAMRLAADYRAAFKRDVFVDLVCYRLHGHNELDDPTFTQPVMYRKIAAHPPVSRSYADRLIREGVLDEQTVKAMESEIAQRLNAAHRRARGAKAPAEERSFGGAWQGLGPAGDDWSARTSVSRATLEQVVRSAARLPDGFHPHPKAAKLLEDRIAMVQRDRIDWGAGELLALGTLLLEGYHVRLSGQDSARGTFSHRHAVLHDAENGAEQVPLQHLAPGQGRFEIINTMLSEAAVLGFEYGYSTADPHTLVIWEAQFGDFANVAQVYIDQFVAGSESKWHRMSGITLLLPHGYEGQGPEHSSARLERFLELCANGNMQVCNLTTPAQLFHALRRQMHRDFRKPLVIMSPKSLLRHKLAVSAVKDFTSEGFRTVIDDASITDPRGVRSVLLTSGKFAYALEEARPESEAGRIAIVRVEQLYPFPRVELSELFTRYAQARDVRWVQEEPANMGAWRHVRHRIESILPEGATLRLVARKASPSPATGYYPMHVEQEQKLLARAFDPTPDVSEPKASPVLRPERAR
jgi:2-oxoglutarate dehydrogenase E1 component